jgi:hypothetical protein
MHRFRRSRLGDAIFLQSFVLRPFGTVLNGRRLRCLELRPSKRFESPSDKGAQQVGEPIAMRILN